MPHPDSTLRYWLGQRSAVIVDRPMGSRHPEFPELAYPVNYGYIPNTEAGDMEPLDAYVLGVEVPISSFIGEVIAIVVRHDDTEDKLAVAPTGLRPPRGEIERATRFQERFFAREIIMHAPDPDTRTPDRP
ncbi:MAG TPA: inorganic diphosphatase [Thermomicrobiales bacterium]|nr:inorganic diphosphatase [Thermomicrobiales bacterium]